MIGATNESNRLLSVIADKMSCCRMCTTEPPEKLLTKEQYNKLWKFMTVLYMGLGWAAVKLFICTCRSKSLESHVLDVHKQEWLCRNIQVCSLLLQQSFCLLRLAEGLDQQLSLNSQWKGLTKRRFALCSAKSNCPASSRLVVSLVVPCQQRTSQDFRTFLQR